MPKRKTAVVEEESVRFAGLRLFLVALGPLKGKVRRDILSKLLVAGGAVAVGDPAEATVIVSSRELTSSVIAKQIGSPPGIVLDADWISDSVKKGERLEFSPYVIGIGLAGPKSTDLSADESHDPNAPKSSTNTGSPQHSTNAELANIFEHLESLAATGPDKTNAFRAMAYRRAASALRRHEKPVRTEEDAEELRTQLGPKSVDKIKEFLRTGKVGKEQFLTNDKSVTARNALMGVWGIGPATAQELYSKGFDSAEKLKADGMHLLNENQKIGLQYYEELLPKIPRAEVEEIVAVVKGSVFHLFGDALDCVVCGSYRRGAELCSDVDFVFAWKDDETEISPELTLERIVTDLEEKGFLLAHFNQKSHFSIFLGIIRLGPTRSPRRVDMKVWPRRSLPFAVLHFTGNADFNRRVRLMAKRKGCRLNDLGLTDAEGKLMELKSEEEIFQALGLQYLPPEQRTSSAQLRALGCDRVTEPPVRQRD